MNKSPFKHSEALYKWQSIKRHPPILVYKKRFLNQVNFFLQVIVFGRSKTMKSKEGCYEEGRMLRYEGGYEDGKKTVMVWRRLRHSLCVIRCAKWSIGNALECSLCGLDARKMFGQQFSVELDRWLKRNSLCESFLLLAFQWTSSPHKVWGISIRWSITAAITVNSWASIPIE